VWWLKLFLIDFFERRLSGKAVLEHRINVVNVYGWGYCNMEEQNTCGL